MNDHHNVIDPPKVVSRRAQRVRIPKRSIGGRWNFWIDPVTKGAGALEDPALGVSLIRVVRHAQSVVVAVVVKKVMEVNSVMVLVMVVGTDCERSFVLGKSRTILRTSHWSCSSRLLL